MIRFALRLAVFAAALSVWPVSAQAPYPNRPVRVIAPFPAGGPVDVVGRPIMDKLSATLGQPFIMDFRPGASSIIGTDAVARADPDGYTILFTASHHSVKPGITEKLPYDTLKDFVAVSRVASGPLLLVVHPSVQAKNVPELIALAKSSPRKLNYASASLGSAFHLAAEMMKSAAKIDMVHIPYKGGAPATNDLLAGHVDLMFGSSVVMPYVRDNRLRLLAVTTGQRSPLIPDVPTVAEQGLPGYDVDTWYGVLSPAGTPKPIVDLLAREIDKAVQDPKVAGSLRAMLLVPGGSDPAQFDAQIAREIAKWRIVAKKANITLDGPK
jgi:tripartite-type tricarboxylate transporter receptor subunit TctC